MLQFSAHGVGSVQSVVNVGENNLYISLPTKNNEVRPMVRHRKSRIRRIYAKTARRARSYAKAGLQSELLGIAAYTFAKPYVSSVTSRFLGSVPDEAVQLGAGLLLRNKGGIVGGAAKAAITINGYLLMQKAMNGGLQNLLTPTTTTPAASNSNDWSNG